MKKFLYNILLAIAAGAATVSCGDWGMLEEHPKKVDGSTYMSNATELQSVVNSIYAQYERDALWGRYLSVLPEALSDYAYGRGNYNTSFTTGLTSGGVGFAKDTWAVLYRTIRFANEIICAIPDAELSKSEYNAISGEVRFLRALSYATLAKYYGGVPLLDETNYTTLYRPRSTEAEIWNYVRAESEEAAKMLAKSVTAGHPSRYSALMLCAEAKIYLKDWTSAADDLQEIVNSRRYSLVRISSPDDFEKVFGVDAASSEELFYIKYNRDVNCKFVWMYLCQPNPVYATGALGVYTDYVNNANIREWIAETGDYRHQYDLFEPKTNGALNTQTKTGMICLKYRDYVNSSSAANDFPLYRYTDVLLALAEAICMRDGAPDADAMECINQIHRRAYGMDPKTSQPNDYQLSDYSSKDAFMELVMKEHGRETIFEAKRYTYLKRLDRLAECALASGRIKELSEVGDAAYWWPIASDEFNYNPYMDPSVDQNPGY
ncbi:MAG: RagB/SusD family nutrient uptake outer membrane protein [Bacteroidales bacterium]|nr:RagB/SusD family nutrient uptake outer membrane protein [Bacteroidales bacterium]